MELNAPRSEGYLRVASFAWQWTPTSKKRRETRFLSSLVCSREAAFFHLQLHSRVLAHSFVVCEAGIHFLLEVVGECLGDFRIGAGEGLEAVFGVDVFCNRDRRLLGVEDKRGLSFGGESRVVTEQSPVTGIHGHLLVLKLAVEIETVVDAGAVADDQRRTIVCFCFLENLQGLSVVCAEGDTAQL